MPPPAWALLERELLRAQATACQEFFDRYFDERGYRNVVIFDSGGTGRAMRVRKDAEERPLRRTAD